MTQRPGLTSHDRRTHALSLKHENSDLPLPSMELVKKIRQRACDSSPKYALFPVESRGSPPKNARCGTLLDV